MSDYRYWIYAPTRYGEMKQRLKSVTGADIVDHHKTQRLDKELCGFDLHACYMAFGGLKKTNDQIDSLYDLSLNQIDQTVSGSDRPEHIQAWSNSEGVGNWQMSVEKEATNYCKESNDLGSIFGGNWTKTEGAGDSPFGDVNEAVEIDMNTGSTGASNYIELSVDTATNFSSGDYITVSFYAKKIAGSSGQPELLIEGEDSNSNPISLIQEAFSTQIGEYQFFGFTAQWSSDGTLRQAGCRIQDNDTNADTVYQFWGMQIESGQYATSRIYTDGGIATRLKPKPELKNLIPTKKGSEKGLLYGWADVVIGNTNNYKRLIIFNNFQDNFDLLQPNSNTVLRLNFFNIRDTTGQFLHGLNVQERATIFYLTQFNNGLSEQFFGYSNGNLRNVLQKNYDNTYILNSRDINLSMRSGYIAPHTSSRHFFIQSQKDFLSDKKVQDIFKKTGRALFNNFQFQNFTDET